VSEALRSGAECLVRGVSRGEQHFDTHPDRFPVTKPVRKLEAAAQCAGEAEYVDDIPLRPGELHGAFVLATVACCGIASVDASVALVSINIACLLCFIISLNKI